MLSRLAVVAALVLCSVAGAQVDTLWVRHHQHAVSFPSQYMSTATTSAVFDAAGNVHICAYGQYAAPGFDAIVVKYAADGNLAWSAGLDLGGSEYAYAIALGPDGGVYVTGTSYSTAGGSDLFVAKWAADGAAAWNRRIQGDSVGGNNIGSAITVVGSRVYVAGSVTNQGSGSDFAVIQLDAATGMPNWLRSVSRSSQPSSYEAAYGIVADGEDVYVCGQTHTGLSAFDATVLRMDSTGATVWQRNWPSSGSGNEHLRRLAVCNGRVVAVGHRSAGASFDALTLSYTTGGSLQWSATFNGPGSGTDQAYDVKIDGAGNAVVCGVSLGSASSDIMTLKYSPTGTNMWARLYDAGGSADAGYSVALDGAGNIVVGGYLSGGSGRYLLGVVKYSPAGDQGWVYAFSPAGSNGFNTAAAVHALGEDVLVAGYTHWGYPNYTDPTALRLREIPDVGVAAILAPTGTVLPGAVVAPVVRVRNYSLRPASCGCRMTIGEGYTADTALSLAPGETLTVTFPNWTAGDYGTVLVKCSTMASFDFDRGNDRALGLVYVSGPARDVALQSIEVPAGNIAYQSTVVPAARWRNRGASPADCSVYCRIERAGVPVYEQARFLAALPANGLDTLIRFAPWLAAQPGYYTVRCSTAATGDSVRSNDVLCFVFGVVNEPIGVWTLMPDVPPGEAGRPMAKGGAVCADAQRVYAIKGNKTRDACSYDASAGTWQTLPPIPDGAYGRPVSKGGAAAADGNGRVYMTKGNRTFEFYRFDPVVGWTELASVPSGPRNKPPAGGTAMAHLVVNDTGWVYLLKGNSTAEFFRYNTVRDSWEALADAPAGLSGKLKYKDGSALAAQGDSLVWCLKGNFNEVFRFDTRSSLWLEGQSIVPFAGESGRRKKVKNGGGMVMGGGRLVVLKGGGTCEFWRLEGADSTWREFPAVPSGMSNRRVKDGGGVGYAGDAFYVLKGAKTNEMWRFRLNAEYGGPQTGSVVPSSRIAPFEAWPSLLRPGQRLSLHAATRSASVRVELVDAAGRLRHSASGITDRSGRLELTMPAIEPGVYFVRLSDMLTENRVKILVCR